jgi:non-heme chloroperoxidase
MAMEKASAFLGLLVFLCAGGAVGQRRNPAPIREGYVAVAADVRIHYLQSGDRASSRALVLIPGWRLPSYLWNEQLGRFGESGRVIAIDPRSQGPSTKTLDGNTPESRARDLHELLGELGVSECVLVGWSQGAQDVAAYLQQFGTGSIAGVVFVDSPVSAGTAEIEIHREFSKAILSNISAYATSPKEFSNGMVHAIFAQPHPDIDFGKLEQSTLQTPTAIGIAMLTADIFGADRRPALARLNKPALAIASAQSPLLEVQKEMAATIPNAKLVVIAGAAHAVFVDQPAKFDAALQAFLQGLPGWSKDGPKQGSARL